MLLCHLDRLFVFEELSLGLFGLLTLSENTRYLETDTFTDTKITQTQCTQTQNTNINTQIQTLPKTNHISRKKTSKHTQR